MEKLTRMESPRKSAKGKRELQISLRNIKEEEDGRVEGKEWTMEGWIWGSSRQVIELLFLSSALGYPCGR